MATKQRKMLEPMVEVVKFDQLIPASWVVEIPKKQQWELDIERTEPLIFKAIKTPTDKVTDDHRIPTHVAIETSLLEPHRARLEKEHDTRQRYIYWPFNWGPDGVWKKEPHLTKREWMCYKQLIGHLPANQSAIPSSLAAAQSTSSGPVSPRTKRSSDWERDDSNKRARSTKTEKSSDYRRASHLPTTNLEPSYSDQVEVRDRITELEEQEKRLGDQLINAQKEEEELRLKVERCAKDMKLLNIQQQNLKFSNETTKALKDDFDKLQSYLIHVTHLYASILQKLLQRKEGLDAGEAWAKAMEEMESKLPVDTVSLYKAWTEKNEEDKWGKDGLPVV